MKDADFVRYYKDLAKYKPLYEFDHYEIRLYYLCLIVTGLSLLYLHFTENVNKLSLIILVVSISYLLGFLMCNISIFNSYLERLEFGVGTDIGLIQDSIDCALSETHIREVYVNGRRFPENIINLMFTTID